MLSLKQGCCLLMLVFPSLTFAASVAYDAVLNIAVAISTLAIIIHGMLVLLLHWGKFFKHNGWVIASFLLSILNLILLIFVCLGYAEDASRYSRSADGGLIGAILMMNFILIIKTLTAPRKQYKQILDLQNKETD